MSPVQSIKSINGLLTLMSGPDKVWRYPALRSAMDSSDDFAKRACRELFDIKAAKRISGGIITGYVYEASMTVKELKALISQREKLIVKEEEAREVIRQAKIAEQKKKRKYTKSPAKRPRLDKVVFEARRGCNYPVYDLGKIASTQMHNLLGASIGR